MRKLILATVALVGLAGASVSGALAAPYHGEAANYGRDHSATIEADYTWQHRHWHHRHWEQGHWERGHWEHGHWRYYD